MEETYIPKLKSFEGFWDKVDKSKDCWEWKGNPTNSGYGNFKRNKAHRVSYFLEYGPFPQKLNVLHKCDNKLCVNPTHLELGGQGKNMKDAVDRGLYRRGNSHHNSKITEEQVRAIRKDPRNNMEVAKDYGINFRTVSKIRLKRLWGWID